METKPLQEFVAENGATEAGRLLGVTPPAICKAIAAKRDITVVMDQDGSVYALEMRSFPSKSGDQSRNSQALPTMHPKIRNFSSANQSADNAGVLSSVGGA